MGMRQVIAFITLLCFCVTGICSPVVRAQGVVLPPPGQMLSLSGAFQPPVLKGIKVFRDDPFRFDFILDKGDVAATDGEVKTDSTHLIKYFLAALTVPEKDLWVNLSPYEKDRIVPEAFGRTEMGRDLLAQDYILKQITASLIFPDAKTGKEFWAKVYAEAQRRYGTTDIPVDTFNKVWIVPEKATVYEHKDAAYVVESRLKVMLETDYMAMTRADIPSRGTTARSAPTTQGADAMSVGEDLVSSRHEIAKNVLRDVVIPILEKEVNEGKNFATLRQVYNSLILATWYKRKIKASLMGQAYVDQKKIAGVDIADRDEKDKIWRQYVEAFKKGAYNFIKEEYDPATQTMIPRKYFSGGFGFQEIKIDFAEANDASIDLKKASIMQLEVELRIANSLMGSRNITTHGDSTKKIIAGGFDRTISGIARKMSEAEAYDLMREASQKLSASWYRWGDLNKGVYVPPWRFAHNGRELFRFEVICENNEGVNEAFIRIGSLFLFRKDFFYKLNEQLRDRLVRNVIFLEPGARGNIAGTIGLGNASLSFYATATIFQMLQDDIEEVDGIDVGAGDGILSLVHHKLTGGVVDLIENDERSIALARRQMALNGLVEGEDFFIHQIDITQENSIKKTAGTIEVRLEKSKRKVAVISNIGKWSIYGEASNQDSMRFLQYIPLADRFIGGGYQAGTGIEPGHSHVIHNDTLKLSDLGFAVMPDGINSRSSYTQDPVTLMAVRKNKVTNIDGIDPELASTTNDINESNGAAGANPLAQAGIDASMMSGMDSPDKGGRLVDRIAVALLEKGPDPARYGEYTALLRAGSRILNGYQHYQTREGYRNFLNPDGEAAAKALDNMVARVHADGFTWNREAFDTLLTLLRRVPTVKDPHGELFIDVLEGFTPEQLRVLAVGADEGGFMVKITEGCRNQCAWCLYQKEKGPVVSMPFPILNKIMQKIDGYVKTRSIFSYLNTEPLDYYDPGVGATFADVVRIFVSFHYDNVYWYTHGLSDDLSAYASKIVKDTPLDAVTISWHMGDIPVVKLLTKKYHEGVRLEDAVAQGDVWWMPYLERYEALIKGAVDSNKTIILKGLMIDKRTEKTVSDEGGPLADFVLKGISLLTNKLKQKLELILDDQRRQGSSPVGKYKYRGTSWYSKFIFDLVSFKGEGEKMLSDLGVPDQVIQKIQSDQMKIEAPTSMDPMGSSMAHVLYIGTDGALHIVSPENAFALRKIGEITADPLSKRFRRIVGFLRLADKLGDGKFVDIRDIPDGLRDEISGFLSKEQMAVFNVDRVGVGSFGPGSPGQSSYWEAVRVFLFTPALRALLTDGSDKGLERLYDAVKDIQIPIKTKLEISLKKKLMWKLLDKYIWSPKKKDVLNLMVEIDVVSGGGKSVVLQKALPLKYSVLPVKAYNAPLSTVAGSDKKVVADMAEKGGIDLDPAQLDLQTRVDGESASFVIDPALLERVKNAPGVTPVIVGIHALDSLRQFLN